MPVHSSYAFVNNRGGTGKSFCLYQTAAAYAKANRDKKVLILDCSSHGDVSQYLLGGTREPLHDDPPASTAGSQVRYTIPFDKTMAGLLTKLLTEDRSHLSILERMSSLLIQQESVTVPDHAVRVSEYSQDMQNIPENIYLCAGGKDLAFGGTCRILFEEQRPSSCRALANLTQEDQWIKLGKALQDAIDKMDNQWVVFFDTVAELRERSASYIALVAAERYIILLTDNWADYLRTHHDPVNALLPTLYFLRQKTEIGKIYMVLFNRVDKVNQENSRLADANGRESRTLPFSPVQVSKRHMEEIADHLFKRCWASSEMDFKRLFEDSRSVRNAQNFINKYISALYKFPSIPTQISTVFGIPFACIDPRRHYRSENTTANIGPAGIETMRVIQETLDAVVQRL